MRGCHSSLKIGQHGTVGESCVAGSGVLVIADQQIGSGVGGLLAQLGGDPLVAGHGIERPDAGGDGLRHIALITGPNLVIGDANGLTTLIYLHDFLPH